MESALILGVVIVSSLVFSAAALLWAPQERLQGFVEIARALGRPI
ncbi:MAG TPA: hypothetical protein VEN79_09455 [Terriglobia bacterium]|nr:hypothetical protein [Terriglobia bacterium]